MEINITVENNQNNEQITDIKDEQKLKDILGETKSQEDNNPKIENENIEKNNDNDNNILQLQNEIYKYQADIRNLIKKEFEYMIQKDAMETKINSYKEMEKEYDILKENKKKEKIS